MAYLVNTTAQYLILQGAAGRSRSSWHARQQESSRQLERHSGRGIVGLHRGVDLVD